MTVTSALAADVHALLGEAVGEPHVLTAPGELITTPVMRRPPWASLHRRFFRRQRMKCSQSFA